MNTHAGKTRENKSSSVANAVARQQVGGEFTFQFVDNRPEAIGQGKLQEMANNSRQAKQASQLQSMANRHSAQKQQGVQKKETNINLPDNLKTGTEELSGISSGDAAVHRNANKPAQLQAQAHAQGIDIYSAAGKEKHVPREAWHVVQRKQGRLKSTLQMKGGEHINDDNTLEMEAGATAFKTIQPAIIQNAGIREFKKKAPVNQKQLPFQFAKGDYNPMEDNSAKIRNKKKEGLHSIVLEEALNKKKWRKVNRITGELYQKSDIIIPLIPGILHRLWSLLEVLKTEPENVEQQNILCLDLMLKIEDGIKRIADNPVNWLQFETLSTLGPLVYWLGEGIESGIPASVNAYLRTLRHQNALRDGLSVVAHRGGGPTNRTRGGLIQQDDPRRLRRPAENSPEAFGAAFSETTGTKADGVGLDGVECDVFLSSDGLPILSHEGAVQEQLSTARQQVDRALGPQTHVEDLESGQLIGTQRTESAHSNFMDLSTFLVSTTKTAADYYRVTQHPFRIEIEMKGKPHEDISPARPPLKDPATYKERLTEIVAKTISQFKKTNPRLPIEIIIFNNSAEDAKAYGKVRETKSRLGGLYTGLGSTDAKVGRDSGVDELRMGASETNADFINNRDYKQFILTLVPGSELDRTPAEDSVNAFRPLIFTPGIEDLDASNAKMTEELKERKKALDALIAERSRGFEDEKRRVDSAIKEIKKEKGDLYQRRNPRPPKAGKGVAVAAVAPSISQEEYERAAKLLEERQAALEAELPRLRRSIQEVLNGLQEEQHQIDTLAATIKEQDKQIAYIKSVNADMARPGESDARAIEKMIRLINETQAKNVHLLTDIPHNAAFYKR